MTQSPRRVIVWAQQHGTGCMEVLDRGWPLPSPPVVITLLLYDSGGLLETNWQGAPRAGGTVGLGFHVSSEPGPPVVPHPHCLEGLFRPQPPGLEFRTLRPCQDQQDCLPMACAGASWWTPAFTGAHHPSLLRAWGLASHASLLGKDVPHFGLWAPIWKQKTRQNKPKGPQRLRPGSLVYI